MTIVPLSRIADAAVEALLDRAFGADRRLRTAYRVRDGLAPVARLSFAALGPDGGLAGTIQAWDVALLADTDGAAVPLTMVGPVAVEPALQNAGLGRALMAATIAAADAAPGAHPLMLVGDPAYYTRFGFDASRTARWRLPGPFEAHRLLARGPVPDIAGVLAGRGQSARPASASAASSAG